MQSEFIFTTPFNVRVEKKGETEEIHLDGFISTTDRDLVDDVVTKNCLESMKQQILEKNLKLDIEHEAFRGETAEEKEINKAKIPAGRMYDAAVETIGSSRFGLRVKSILNNFRNDFEKIKGSVMNKFLDAYSIAFIPTKTSFKEIDGKSIRLLDDVVLLNVAMTGNPINTTAQNRDIFMKAINSIDDYKKEKKSNPGIEKELNVKSIEGKPGNVGYVNCPHCGKKIKKSEIKDNSQSHDKELNQGGKIMDQKDENQEETQASSEESGKEESQESQDSGESQEQSGESQESSESGEEQKADNEEEDEDEESNDEENKALRKKVKALESEVSDLKAKLSAPNHKGDARPKEKKTETKSLGPLDHLN